uniref:AlNc14C440G11661 protein n=1 Tax=Albugo laibachii Nc14 TaxID=890382 RepID=F0WZS0_9STRA|nr:AlNc14C440G11661 [Albugo laibachii Nc14]|eukprot:CCA26997.1 AlNc14C440G11661 [Albugo laibachii Nc14]
MNANHSQQGTGALLPTQVGSNGCNANNAIVYSAPPGRLVQHTTKSRSPQKELASAPIATIRCGVNPYIQKLTHYVAYIKKERLRKVSTSIDAQFPVKNHATIQPHSLKNSGAPNYFIHLILQPFLSLRLANSDPIPILSHERFCWESVIAV